MAKPSKTAGHQSSSSSLKGRCSLADMTPAPQYQTFLLAQVDFPSESNACNVYLLHQAIILHSLHLYIAFLREIIKYMNMQKIFGEGLPIFSSPACRRLKNLHIEFRLLPFLFPIYVQKY